jgi:Mg-chelatase subunit ChlI
LHCQARANRGILYVDEVNLLDDGLVDVVLDSSASGINTVEREGISIAHPAKFIMIGSGNPAVSHTRGTGKVRDDGCGQLHTLQRPKGVRQQAGSAQRWQQ